MTPANPAHRILLVDDEVRVLNALCRSLSHEPYQITATTSQSEAIHLLESQEFTVIITDQRMPEMPGVQLVEHAKTVSPHTIRLILTGNADMQSVIEGSTTARCTVF